MNRFSHVVLSELIKLGTLRSIQGTIFGALLIMPALAAFTAPLIRDALITNDPSLAPGTTPDVVGLDIVGLGQIATIVIGVIAASSEYQGGQITTTVLATPQRATLFAAKVVAVGAVAAAMGVIAIPATSLVAQYYLKDLSLLQHGIPSGLIAKWLFAICGWVAISLISFALAAILKQAFLPLFVLLTLSQLTLVMVHLIPKAAYLPFSAAVQLYDPASITAETPAAAMTPMAAALALISWTGVFLAASGGLFMKRDIKT